MHTNAQAIEEIASKSLSQGNTEQAPQLPIIAADKLAKTERRAATRCLRRQSFPPLSEVTSPTVPTEQAAFYTNRQSQTLRAWAAFETYPEGLKPIRVLNRLAWPVEGIKRVMGVE